MPAKIRDAAIMEMHKACVALNVKEKKFKRQLKFRSSKDHNHSINIESQALNCKTCDSAHRCSGT